jgi:Pyruvate/2-oxoacid:ferredoxin oxidoreductase gamma subunit
MMEDLNVVIAGAAGEGVQTVGEVLAETIAGHGYAVFAWQEFESRIRGGQNSYCIRISEKPDNAPAMRADILLVLNDGAAMKYGPLIQPAGILIAENKDSGPDDSHCTFGYRPEGAGQQVICQHPGHRRTGGSDRHESWHSPCGSCPKIR